MSQLARAGKKSPPVRQLAVDLTRYLPQKDWLGEITALHEFVRDKIRYVKDTRNVETLHTAEKILDNGAGDCDDKSILLASLLESLGHKTRFVAIGFRPGRFSHVYVETYHAGKWIPLETTEPVNVGWSPKNVKVKMYSSNDDKVTLGDLGGKRVKAYLANLASQVQAAYAKANTPEATPEDIAAAQKLADQYAAEMANYDAAAAKKAKSLGAKLKAMQEKKISILAKISPSSHAHLQQIERTKKIQRLQDEALHLQGKAPTTENQARLNAIQATIQLDAKKSKKYMKEGVIAATIASIVIGIFTFGGGAAAVQGAYQALKQGAIQAAQNILKSALVAAIAKGALPKDSKKAQQAINDLSNYPPDPNLPNLDSMLADSQAKKQAAVEKTLTWAIPAGAIALLFLI